MSVCYRIKTIYEQLTDAEKRIADFISQRKDFVTTQSSSILAKATQTSPSAWNHFAKKAGYRGITELKIAIAQDSIVNEVDLFIDAHDTVDYLVQKEQRIFEQSLKSTVSLIHTKSLQSAIDLLCEARRIFIVGVGGSGVMATDLMHKLTRIGKNVVYQSDTHVLLAQLGHLTANDVLIAISYSGKTREVQVAVNEAEKVCCPIIAITGFNPQSELSRMATVPLYIPIKEGDVRLGAIQSRNATFIITDLLYYGLVAQDVQQTRAALVKTRDIINQMK